MRGHTIGCFVFSNILFSSSTVWQAQLAGLVAKANIAHVLESMAPEVLRVVQGFLLIGLVDPERTIRSTSNNIICTIARRHLVLEAWLELFPALVDMLERGDETCVCSRTPHVNIINHCVHVLMCACILGLQRCGNRPRNFGQHVRGSWRCLGQRLTRQTPESHRTLHACMRVY
jgi:hypothetical protein